MNTESCPLCDIRLSEPQRVVYTDDHCFVAVNFEPLKYGHVMVLPNRCVENLSDLGPDEAKIFLDAIDRCMIALSMEDESAMCIINGWGHRTQRHLHAHVLPSKESIRGLFAASEGVPRRKRATNEALAKMANTIREKMAH